MDVDVSRPLIQPWNRKLRHLRAIWLRNLTFSPSRASDRLTDTAKQGSLGLENGPHNDERGSTGARPWALRRRSTNATPYMRQQTLQQSTGKCAAAAFLSIHVDKCDGPIYISECIDQSVNFNFSTIDLDVEPLLTRSAVVRVKVWTKRKERWSLHLEQQCDFRQLRYIGDLDEIAFPSNCLVFHMVDGAYTLDLPARSHDLKAGPTVPCSSYNALMHLSNLATTADESMAMRKILEADAACKLAKHSVNGLNENGLHSDREHYALVSSYLGLERRALERRKRALEQLKRTVVSRRSTINEEKLGQRKKRELLKQMANEMQAHRSQAQGIRDQIRGQRRRICENLSNVLSILPASGNTPLNFSICGLRLPNTEYEVIRSGGEEALSAALGLITLLALRLEAYLGVPLSYALHFCGSRSSIRDDISQLADPNRDFPLYLPKGGSSALYRFDYAWFLLNKDIEALCASQGLKLVDIRHSLPNLKYLLYVCSAGVDELPERKKGGVRGLWQDRIKGKSLGTNDDAESAASSSRRGSFDSDTPGSHLDAALAGRNGHSGAAEQQPGARRLDGILSLRTKGLRENVG